MMTAWLAALALTVTAFGQEAEKKNAPAWIWLTKSDANETIYLRREVVITGNVIEKAVIGATCDNAVKLYVNGQKVIDHKDFANAAIADVTKILKPGKNVLAAECTNAGGPAGLIMLLKASLDGDRKQFAISDGEWVGSPKEIDGWKTADFDAKDWAKVVTVGKWGDAPWGEVLLLEEGPPPESTSVADIVTLPGFQVERLYSVPKATEGSWVSMTSDPKGRLIVSDQYGGLFRITPGKSEADTKIEHLTVEIGHAQGLLYAFDSLYVVVNGTAAQGSGFYRVKDTNNDDQFDSVELLKKFDGTGEHGPHAVKLGPDGLLYVIAGNHTKPPADFDPLSPCRHWGEDHLLKRNPDGNGHATGVMAPGGWICKTDPDGKYWQIVTSGFRNQYDIDFNLDGELFTFDADMEYDTGSPWYRPTRVNHCVSGGEFGWRYGTGKWPAYFVDSLGAVVDVGLGSPTGISFGSGAKFPEKYQRALYLCDWTYGKLYAVHMTPQGASYTGTFETFVSGKPLPLTDVVVHSDGALYFTIGGRKTQSGLYRVTYTGNEFTAAVESAGPGTAAKARSTRRFLEEFHAGKNPSAIAQAWPYLNSPDRHLRFAARVAIENQDLALWQEQALAETKVNAQIQALLLLSRVGTHDLQAAVLERLNKLPFGQLTEEQMLDTLRVYQLAFIRLGGKQPETAPAVLAALEPLYPQGSEFVNRELCQVLSYLEAPTVLEKSLKLLSESTTQQDQMFYAFALRNVQPGWSLDQRRAFYGWLNLAEEKYKGGASFVKFLNQIRADAGELMTAEDKTALKDIIEDKRPVTTLQLTAARQFLHNWQVDDFPGIIAAAAKGRNFERGKAAYEATQCAKCHRFKGTGGDTGPDITGVGNRFDALYLLESFVIPSKVVSDQYVNHVIETSDGRVITGRIIKEEPDTFTVRTDPFARELTVVKKSDIESKEPSKTSEMPQGLVNVLTQDEVLDLIAYLRAAGDAADKAFQP